MLARRLINQQSTSMDAEEFMVTKLKVTDSLRDFIFIICFILNSKHVAMNLLEN